MKKLIVAVLIGVMAIPSMAQEWRVGATAGVNVNATTGVHYRGQTGFNVGVKAELGLPQVTNGLFMDLGGSLSSHGWKRGYYDNSAATLLEWKATPYYLNIPVHVGYKFRCCDNLKLFASVGPYANIGLFGKEAMIATLGEASTKTTVLNNVFADKAQERFDWGLGFRVGAELYDHWQLSVGYDWGMESIFKGKDVRNRTLSISCSYVF